MIAKAEAFARRVMRLTDVEAALAAQGAVSFAWEECKYGRATAEDEQQFWALVSERVFKEHQRQNGRHVSLDAPLPGTDGEIDRHSSGWSGYQPPDQIAVVYLKEVIDGIGLLPEKHRAVLALLAEGLTALDVSQKLRIPIHTAFARISEARNFLLNRELIGAVVDRRRRFA